MTPGAEVFAAIVRWLTVRDSGAGAVHVPATRGCALPVHRIVHWRRNKKPAEAGSRK
jgi:hypothetical protein